MSGFKPDVVAVALGLITLGVLWLLANLGRLDLITTVRTWWPSVLIVWGVLELVKSISARGGSK
jgi:LiaF transmembrane domain